MYIIHYILDITEIVVCPLACWESSLNKCLNQRLECSLEWEHVAYEQWSITPSEKAVLPIHGSITL